MQETLSKLGFTDGEIRVYEALIELQESSVGDIISRSEVSSSKVYNILAKLEKRGLVSHIIINNKKLFRIAPPSALQELVNRKQAELVALEEEVEDLIPIIMQDLGVRREHDAQVYIGTKGIRTLYTRILEEATNEYCVFAITNDEISSDTATFLANFHAKRVEKGINLRIIAPDKVVNHHKNNDILHDKFKIKATKQPLPFGAVIGQKRIAIMLFDKSPVAFEIVSETITKKFQEYFDAHWD